jgi:uncharacterized protein with HEPN domain
MQANERDAAYIWDMLKAAQDIQEFMSGVKFEQFNKDRKLQYAIERCVEIVGEAARRTSEELKKNNPEIPWSRIIAQRNVLAHEYDDVKQERMWLIATVHIPALIPELEALLPPPPPPTE